MLRCKKLLFALTAWLVLCTSSGWAYVDLAPTLTRIVREAQTITVAEVTAFNQGKGAIILKKVRDLKGVTGTDPLKHELVRADESAMDAPIADWAGPSQRCVLFVTGKAAVVCIGEGWYQAYALDNGWWRIGTPRPDLGLAYYGSVSRLSDALSAILAGKKAIITALPHGADRAGASFDLALQRANLPGLVKVERLRAGKGMPDVAMGVGSNPAWVIGLGRVGKDELPDLRTRLKSDDAAVQAESAADIGYLGPEAADAVGDLAKLLDDKVAGVRMAAAAALLRITGANARAVHVLSQGLTDADPATRRLAARSTGLAGRAAAPLVDDLTKLLSDPDLRVRRSSLQTIATLGPAAVKAREAVTRLLDRPDTSVDAADALGRMGAGARPDLKTLARLLESESPAQRWAAVRAMSQIGGPDAAPAVNFMIQQLPKASEADGYNMLIYLSLLGPVARDAIPAVHSSHVRNPFLRQTTVWAIDPSTDPPSVGPMGDGDVIHYLFEAYVQELGDHLKPAAQALAKNIMAGKAGHVPGWGYKLLAKFPEESLAVLGPGLADSELVMRERAAVAIGYMGRAAKGTRPKVEQALKTANDERERLLMRWCLRELE